MENTLFTTIEQAINNAKIEAKNEEIISIILKTCKSQEVDVLIDSGVYYVEKDTEVMQLCNYNNGDSKTILEFIKKQENIYIAAPYEMDMTFILSKKPTRVNKNLIFGHSSFNHGACSIIQLPIHLPEKEYHFIMIVYEND